MKKWYAFFKNKKTAMMVAAILVVFVTTYSLILPALTVEASSAAEAGIILDQDAADNAKTAGTVSADPSADTSTDSSAADSQTDGTDSTAVSAPAADDKGTYVAAEAEEPNADAIEMPAQTFEAELKEEKITVYASAEEGAFPEGTEMKAEAVSDEENINKITEAAEKEFGDKMQIRDIEAIDITFWLDDAEIEPEQPIDVTIASEQLADEEETEAPLIIHINDEDSDKVADVDKGKAEVIIPMTEKELEKKDIKLAEDEIAFTAGQFSVYAIVYPEAVADDADETAQSTEEADAAKAGETEEADANSSTQPEAITETDGQTDAADSSAAVEAEPADDAVDAYSYEMVGGTEVSLKKVLKDLGIKNMLTVNRYVTKDISRIDTAEDSAISITKTDRDYTIGLPVKAGKDLRGETADFTIVQTDGEQLQIDVTVSGKPEIDLGTAVISAADNSYLPEDASGHADVVDGTKSIKKVQNYTDNKEEQGIVKYTVFDIGVDNVAESSYKEGFDVQVNLPETIAGKDFHLYHIHGGTVEELDIDINATETTQTGEAEISGFHFTTDGFSEFVLSYTVDFEYVVDGQKYAFSMAGGDSIDVGELLEKIGVCDAANKDAFVEQIENVEFSDPELVEVVHTTPVLGVFGKENWILKSLAPFHTDELLTITMKDGQKLVINVRDFAYSSDLKDFLTNVTISAPTNAEGHYVVRPGTSYDVNLTFRENSSYQFNENGTLSYNLPAGMSALDSAGSTIDISFVDESGHTVTISGNEVKVENGVLKVTWNQNDPNYESIGAANNLNFTINIKAQFDENADKIKFSDTITKDVDVDNSKGVTVAKSGSFDAATGKIWYEVKVTSTGSNTDIDVADAIRNASSSALTIDTDSFTFSKEPKTKNITSTGFTANFDSMTNGEVVTIKYSASVDYSKISGSGTAQQTGNDVTVTTDGKIEKDSKDFENNINYTSLTKSDGEVDSSKSSGNTQVVSWKIDANKEKNASMAGRTITDTIDSGSTAIMKYPANGGITVVVKDKDGKVVRTDNLNWGQGGLSGYNASTWTYTVPTTDTEPYEYEITYNTEVNVAGKIGDTEVKNKVESDNGKSDEGKATVPPGDDGTKLVKDGVISEDGTEVNWTVTFVVPKNGLTSAVVTDELPATWGGSNNSQHLIDAIKDGTLKVTGVNANEQYILTYNQDDQNPPQTTGFKITFYKEAGHSENDASTGLNGGTSERTITVTYTTTINTTWTEESPAAKHTNKVTIDANGQSDTKTKDITPKVKSIEKSAYPETTVSNVEINGVSLPVYKYQVHLTGVDGPIVIEDTFPTEYLRYLDIHGGVDPVPASGADTYWEEKLRGHDNGYVGPSNPPTVETTSTGIKFTFSEDNIPKEKGEYCNNYYFEYFLVVKDEAALNALKAAASNADENTAILTNRASYGGKSDDATVKYKYKPVSKEILTSDAELSGKSEIYADYRITLNELAQTFNGGNAITATDTFENLSIDYDTIQATPSEGVSWDFSGSTVTFTIPDATKVVITYRARVIKSGQIKNTVSFQGEEDEITKNATRDITGGGTASAVVMNLLKYESGDMTKPLAGAEFQLLDKDKNPIKDKYGQDVIFVTNSSGKIQVYGNQKRDGWSIFEDEQYYLREIKAPAGFQLLDYDAGFKISSDGTADYDNYVYHSGDTMTAKDKPGTQVPVEKVWSDGNDAHSTDQVTVKLQKKVNNEWQDVAGKTTKLNQENDWSDVFLNLDYVDDNDKVIEYRVVETSSHAGYESSVTGNAIDGFVITNAKQGSVYFTKSWVNEDGSTIWPTDVTLTVELMKQIGTNTPESLGNDSVYKRNLTSTSDSSQFEWNNLPELADGYHYVVVETEVDGYAAYALQSDGTYAKSVISQVYQGKAAITNAEKTKVDFTKKWVGTINDSTDNTSHNNRYNLRIGIKLHQYIITRTGLVEVKNYDSSIADYFTEKIVYGEKREYGGSSDWGGSSSGKYVETTAEAHGENWSYEWQNLPTTGLDSDGNVVHYVYKVTEEKVYLSSRVDYTHDDLTALNPAEYVKEYGDDELSVTNMYNEPTDISATKKWVDLTDNADHPEIKFYLLMNGERAKNASGNDLVKTIPANAEGEDLTVTWTGMNLTDETGKTIEYSVEEYPVPSGYKATVEGNVSEGFTVTNKSEDVNGLTVTKRYTLPDGVTPASTDATRIYFKLMAQYGSNTGAVTGIYIDGATQDQSAGLYYIDKNADGSWGTVSFENLPSNPWNWSATCDGYYVVEMKWNGSAYVEVTDDVLYTFNGTTVDSNHRAGTSEEGVLMITNIANETNISATKEWDDESETHPEITLHLKQNGKEYGTAKKIAANATGNDLTVKWEKLPRRDADGQLYVYTVTEDPVSGYKTKITGNATDGFVITNRPTSDEDSTELHIEKKWLDESDKDITKSKTGSISYDLYKVLASEDPIFGSGSGTKKNFTAYFRKSDHSLVYEANKQIAVNSALNYFFNFSVKSTDIDELKTWLESNLSGVTLVDNYPIAVDEGEGLYTFKYKITNPSANGWSSGDIKGYDTGKHIVNGAWFSAEGDGNDSVVLQRDAASKLPASAKIQSGTVSSSNNWSTKITGLEKADNNGIPYNYYIVETSGSNGLTTYEYADGDVTVTNHDVELTEITVKKVRNANASDDQHKQFNIKLQRSADNGSTWTDVADSQQPFGVWWNGSANEERWEYTWDSLKAKDSSGATYIYRAVENEANQNGYVTTYINNDGIENGVIIVDNTKNNYTGIKVEKIWLDADGNVDSESTHPDIKLTLKRAEVAETGKNITVNVNWTHQVTENHTYWWWYDHGISDSSWKARSEYNEWENTNYSYTKTEVRSYEPKTVDSGTQNVTITINTDGTLQSSSNTYIKSINGNQVVFNQINDNISVDLYLQGGTWMNDPSWSNVTYNPPAAPADSSAYTKVKEFNLSETAGYSAEWQDTNVSSDKVYYYIIEEADPGEGYALKQYINNGTTTGVIYAVNQKEAPQTGSLKITKNVTVNGTTPTSDADKALVNGSYQFTVKDSSGTEITGSPFTITVNNGVSNTIEVSDLEAGKYTISELTPTNGTTLTSPSSNSVEVTVTAGESGDDVETTGIGSFTNNINTGSITVTKSVTANGATTPTTYKIALKGADGKYYGTNGTVLTDATKWIDVTISGTSGSQTWSNLPIQRYTVEEDETAAGVEHYNLTFNAGSGVTLADEANATGSTTVTNTYTPNPGELDIIKAVKAGSNASGQTFTFTVMLTPATDTNIDTTKLDVTGAASFNFTKDADTGVVTGTITITGTGTAKITGIPAGTTYTVEETNIPDNWSKVGEAYSDSTKTIAAGDIDTVTVKNQKLTSINGTKTWIDGKWIDDTEHTGIRPDTLEIKLYSKVKDSTADFAEVTAGTYTVVWDKTNDRQNVWSYTISNLPKYNDAGAELEYDTKENVPTNYVKLMNDSDNPYATDWQFSDDGDFTNTQLTPLMVSKSWQTSNTNGIVAILFYISLDDQNLGQAIVTASDNWAAKQFTKWNSTDELLVQKYALDDNGVYAIQYTVTEVGAWIGSYDPENPGNNFVEASDLGKYFNVPNSETISGDSPTVTFTNTAESTSVQVDKKWFQGTDDVTSTIEKASLKVTLSAEGWDGKDINGDDVTATVSLPNKTGNKWSASWSNLPKYGSDGKELKYKVTESDVKIDDDDLTAAGAETVTAGKATIKNILPTTQLTVTKAWANDTWPEDVTSVQATIAASGTTTGIGTLIAKSTGATTTVVDLTSSDDSMTWNNLPKYDDKGNKITYSVSETSVTMKDGTILSASSTPTMAEIFDISSSTSGTTTTITNTQLTGELEVTKELKYNGVPDTVEADQAFYAALFNAAGTRISDVKEIRILAGNSSRSVKFQGLKAGIAYTLKETDQMGTPVGSGFEYAVEYENQNFTLKRGELNKTAKITNNKNEKGQLTVNKTVKYNGETDTTVGTTEAPATFNVAIFTKSGETYTKVGETKAIKVVAGVTTESAVFTDLDIGTTYYVFEMNGEDRVGTAFGEYSVTGSGANFTPSRTAKNGTKEIVNEKSETGKLTVTKQLKKDNADFSATKAETFTVGLYEQVEGEWIAVNEPDKTTAWTKTISIAAGSSSGTAEFSPLTVGKTYRVYELDGDNTIANNAHYEEYTVTYSDDGGVAIARGDKDKTTTVTNNKETTNIKATKTWFSDVPEGTSVEVTIKATVPGATEGSTTDVTSSITEISNATQTISGKTGEYTWNNLPRYYDGKEVTYTVTETKVTIGGTVKWPVANGSETNPYQVGDVNVIGGTEFAFTNNLTTIYVQKRFTRDSMGIENWQRTYNGGTVYFKLWRVDDSHTGGGYYVDETGYKNSGKVFSVNYSDTAVSPGDYSEGEGADKKDYIKKGDTLNYTYTIPNLPAGTYQVRECNQAGTTVLTEPNAGYMTCEEMNDQLLVMKNIITSVTAAKHWDDKGNTVSEHPDVTFILQQKIGDGNWTDVSEKTLSDKNKGDDYHAAGTKNANGDIMEYPFVEWDNLPVWDISSNAAITYRTVEKNATTIPGYKPVGPVLADQTEVTKEGKNVLGSEGGKHETFTNELQTIEIEVTKAWDPATVPSGAEITLTLTGGGISKEIKLNGKSDWPDTDVHKDWDANTWETYTDSGNSDDARESDAWHALWKNLPKYDSSGNLITYTITETAVTPTGYTADYGKTASGTTATSVVLIPKQDDENKYTGELTNIKRVDLNILKVDRSDGTTPLKDAEFKIRKIVGTNASTIETDTNFTEVTVTTGTDGKAKFEDLPAGYYEIEETKMPNGHVLSSFSGKAYIKIDEDGVTLLNAVRETAPEKWEALGTSDADKAYLSIEATTLTVGNDKGVALPSTGGPGTTLFTALGSLIIAFAGAVLLLRRRKQLAYDKINNFKGGGN